MFYLVQVVCDLVACSSIVALLALELLQEALNYYPGLMPKPRICQNPRYAKTLVTKNPMKFAREIIEDN